MCVAERERHMHTETETETETERRKKESKKERDREISAEEKKIQQTAHLDTATLFCVAALAFLSTFAVNHVHLQRKHCQKENHQP